MSITKAYSDKLKDPRWQKKRLEIMNRDDFTCQTCGDKETTLNIHHIEYSGQPWEAKDDCLITLCKDCHREVEYFKPTKKQLKSFRILKLPYKNESNVGMFILISFNNTVGMVQYNEKGVYMFGISFGNISSKKIHHFFNRYMEFYG